MGKALTSVSIVSIRLIEASTKSRGDTSFDLKRATASVAVILIKSSVEATMPRFLPTTTFFSNLFPSKKLNCGDDRRKLLNFFFLCTANQAYDNLSNIQ